MSDKDIYNVSEEEQKIIQWRNAKRQQLREMYLKDSGHPTRSILCDTGIYRFSSTNATAALRFIPTLTGFLQKSILIVSLIAVTYFGLEKRRSKQEHLYRTGQISYADRGNKFV